MIHKPVLLKEAIDCLNLKPGMTVIDGTLGAGGHSIAILEKILPGGKLISIDWDEQVIRSFEKKLRTGIYIAKRKWISACPAPVNINKKNDNRALNLFKKLGNREGKIVGYWHGAADNFKNIEKISRGLGVKTADAVFVDLGFSSDQIEDPKRGFSFLRNGPLDMRYSPQGQESTAGDVINKYSEKELAEVFLKYGEEKFAKRIAKKIRERREIRRIESAIELAEVVSKSIPEKFKKEKINPATKVFQALRIEVNQELENLKKFLDSSMNILASEGRLAVISFHSLEDRIVKNFFRKESRGCVCPPRFPQCVCGQKPRLKILTKKPVVASEMEIRQNPRSRSAKLRVAQKIKIK